MSDDRSTPSSPPERPLRPRSWDRQPAPPPPFDPTAGAWSPGAALGPGVPGPGVPLVGGGPAAPRLAGPRAVRDRTPVDRLSPQARSVVVPAVVAVLLILVTPVVALVALAVGLRDATASGGGAADDAFDECRAERAEIQDDLAAFRTRTGRHPAGDDEIPPYDHDRFIVRYDEWSTDVDTVPGSPCDQRWSATTWGTTGQRAGAEDDSPFGDLAEAMTFDEPLQLVAAGLGGMAVGSLSWWLACAHRCLPRRERSVDPSRAYGPVWVLAAGFVAISFIQGLALASGYDPTGSLFVSYLWLGTTLAASVAMVRALRVSADMIGDVTHVVAGGHAPTRIMKAALTTMLWACGVILASTVVAIGSSPFLVVAGLATLVLLAAHLVALVAYGMGVVMATLGIERTLGEAAAQLDAEDAAALAAL